MSYTDEFLSELSTMGDNELVNLWRCYSSNPDSEDAMAIYNELCFRGLIGYMEFTQEL